VAVLAFWNVHVYTTTMEVDMGSFSVLSLAALLILALAVVVVQARRRASRT